MKKNIFILSLLLATAFTSSSFAKDTYVNGYYRQDGSYVQGHYRSGPNHTQYDNWSTKGNTNPYTGEKGTKDAYY